MYGLLIVSLGYINIGRVSMFLVECRIVERECRSLGRLKDVELWRGKNLQKPLVDLKMWNVEHGEETLKKPLR